MIAQYTITIAAKANNRKKTTKPSNTSYLKLGLLEQRAQSQTCLSYAES